MKKLSGEAKKERLHCIYETYFTANAELEVNVPGKLSGSFRKALEEGKLDEPECMNALLAIQSHVFDVLKHDAYQRFKTTVPA